jgi:hypothetical protein
MSKSMTLELIMKHWIGPLPEAAKDDKDLAVVPVPFDIENFCLENDQLLNLITIDPTKRKLWAKQTLIVAGMPSLQIPVWAVYEGDQFAKQQGKKPVAWFMNDTDCNRYVNGVDV